MLIGARDIGEMTAEQRATHDRIASGPRGGVPHPFFAMLDAPHFAEAIQSVGEAIRFHGVLDQRHREVAILAAAAAFGSGYEWTYHEAIARDLGLSDAELAAVRDGSGTGLPDVEQAIVGFVFKAVRDRQSDQDVLARLSADLGRAGATEIVTIAGYYPLLALFLSAGELDQPMPTDTP
ncbi:MAG: carboxymuconolactone decarboxylase family protein [Bauldia litoralis]